MAARRDKDYGLEMQSRECSKLMGHFAASNKRILFGVWALAALGLVPFTIYHITEGNWYLAGIIGGLNLLLAAGPLYLYLLGQKPEALRFTGYALVVVSNVVALLSIHAQGGPTAYWIYPIIFANFYLLPFAAGTGLSLVFASLSLLAVSSSVQPDFLARLLVTTPLCFFFGVVFSLGMNRQRKQLQYLASHDALTGIGNRHALDSGLADAVARKKRYDERCSLIIFDIDRFKEINDSMGHMHADGVIVELARLMADRVRAVDRVYRFGGEEFVLILPHTSAQLSWQLAEALRMDVEEHGFAGNTHIAVSAGVAELAGDEGAEDWLRRADDALIRAKRAGRNRVMAAEPPEGKPERPARTPNATSAESRENDPRAAPSPKTVS